MQHGIQFDKMDYSFGKVSIASTKNAMRSSPIVSSAIRRIVYTLRVGIVPSDGFQLIPNLCFRQYLDNDKLSTRAEIEKNIQAKKFSRFLQ